MVFMFGDGFFLTFSLHHFGDLLTLLLLFCCLSERPSKRGSSFSDIG